MSVRVEVVEQSEIQKKALPQEVAPAKPYVLVVDDESLIADTLVAILRQHGYAADAAYNGASAMEAIKLIPPDLLITDVAMPGISGVDLAIAVRKSLPNCKVLLFSGQASTSDLLREAERAGHTFTLLSKPVHPRDLLAHTSTLISPRQPSKQEVQRIANL